MNKLWWICKRSLNQVLDGAFLCQSPNNIKFTLSLIWIYFMFFKCNKVKPNKSIELARSAIPMCYYFRISKY